MSSVKTQLDGTTLVAVSACGSIAGVGASVSLRPMAARSCRRPSPSPTARWKALARAHRWQRMLGEGRFASVRELDEAERVGHSYTGRILRLTLLAPDIVEHLLDGRRAPQLADLMQPFPVAWERQREQFC